MPSACWPGEEIGPVVLASPDLRPSVLGVARSLVDAGLLRRFVTTLAVFPPEERSAMTRLAFHVRPALDRALAARQAPTWLQGRLQVFPLREVVRLAAQRCGLGPVACDRVWEWAETGFDRRVARAWAGRVPCIYGCEHASAATFQLQHQRGGLNVLWQVSAHHRTAYRLVREQLERFPETTTAYARHALQTADRVNGRKDAQYALADLIVANSYFVRQTFLEAGIPADRVVAIPTGCPRPVVQPPSRSSRGPMIFLSAGKQNVLKGTHLLLEAWRRVASGRAGQLLLVGTQELPACLVRDLPDNVVLRPPVPRGELEQMFHQASVFVLPTLCEGRAHVILEALAHGLPVLTTGNSGCSDVVRDGINGWLTKPGDVESLAERLAWCLDHPDPVAAMGLASLDQAACWQQEDFAALHAQTLAAFLRDRGRMSADRPDRTRTSAAVAQAAETR